MTTRKKVCLNFLPCLENAVDDDLLWDYIRKHSKSFEFFIFDHLTNDFMLGDSRKVIYLCGFADGVRFYQALKTGSFNEDFHS